MIYVLNTNGEPLMPTTNSGYIRKLIDNKQCVVKQHLLFTVQLSFDTTNNVQPVTLGIDPGFSHIGFSALSDDKELLSVQFEQEGANRKGKFTNPTSQRLAEKLMYRRNRRSRKWHREPRWMNRVSSKKEGWLSPSIKRKKDSHINMVSRIKKILPITKIVIEKNKFDIAAIENPEIQGIMYQQGTLHNYQNKKSYLLSKQGGICPVCGEKLMSGIDLHHVVSKSKGGSDNVDNLVALHEDCHTKLHKENLKLSKNGFVKKHRQDTFMNIVRHRLVDELNADVTFGTYTKASRIVNNIDKTHYSDAFVIAGGTTQPRCNPIILNQKRRNNRSLQKNNLHTKGGRSIRRQRSHYQSGDLVWAGNRRYTCGGMQNGYVVIGKKMSKSGNATLNKVNINKITSHFCSNWCVRGKNADNHFSL
jgi:hypothetical protein